MRLFIKYFWAAILSLSISIILFPINIWLEKNYEGYVGPMIQMWVLGIATLILVLIAGFSFGYNWNKYENPTKRIKKFLKVKLKQSDRIVKSGWLDIHPKINGKMSANLLLQDGLNSSEFDNFKSSYLKWRKDMISVMGGVLTPSKFDDFSSFINRVTDREDVGLRIPLKKDISVVQGIMGNIKRDWISKEFDLDILDEYKD